MMFDIKMNNLSIMAQEAIFTSIMSVIFIDVIFSHDRQLPFSFSDSPGSSRDSRPDETHITLLCL